MAHECVFCGDASADDDKPLCAGCWYPAGISMRCDNCHEQRKGGRELARWIAEHLDEPLVRAHGVICMVAACPSCQPTVRNGGYVLPYYVQARFLAN